jgi:hypothetical protein
VARNDIIERIQSENERDSHVWPWIVDEVVDEIEALRARVGALEAGCVRAAACCAYGGSASLIISDLLRLLGKEVVR